MIFEYAIEPALLDNWKDIRYFKDQCGAEKGRLISEYPSRWERAVFEAIRLSSSGPVEKHRMKEAVRNILKYKLFRRPRISWDNEQPWLDNAKAEHRTRPFHAIVTNASEDDVANHILSGHNLDESKALWNCNCGSVARTATDMAHAVKPLLILSQSILFVDPHFNPAIARFRNPLIAMLRILATRDNEIPIQMLQYHIANKFDFNESQFRTDVDTLLNPQIPSNLTMSFVKWNATEMHNRYIITNIGALRFGIGLDEYTGSSPRSDEIERLSDMKRVELWQKYSVDGGYDVEEI